MSEDMKLSMLIARIKAGDNQAFDVIYREHVTPVYRYVYARVRSVADAEDIVQETFIRAYKAIDRYEDQHGTFFPYLFTIARNLLINHTRKKKPSYMEPEVMDREDSGIKTPEGEAIAEEESLMLRRAMDVLSESEREIVELRFFGQQSYSEIAEVLGKREDAIRQHVARAMRKLRKHLDENGEQR